MSRRTGASSAPISGKRCTYYFYFVGAEFGLIYLRVPTWAPSGDSIADIDDCSRAQSLADSLSPSGCTVRWIVMPSSAARYPTPSRIAWIAQPLRHHWPHGRGCAAAKIPLWVAPHPSSDQAGIRLLAWLGPRTAASSAGRLMEV